MPNPQPTTSTHFEEDFVSEFREAFEREERYIVIKRKYLSEQQERDLREGMRLRGIGTVECVVVESDWPEYETVWKMIEDRVTGRSHPVEAEALEWEGPAIEWLRALGKQNPPETLWHAASILADRLEARARSGMLSAEKEVG